MRAFRRKVIFSCRGIGARSSRFSGRSITVPSACMGCALRPIEGQGRQPGSGLPRSEGPSIALTELFTIVPVIVAALVIVT